MVGPQKYALVLFKPCYKFFCIEGLPDNEKIQ